MKPLFLAFFSLFIVGCSLKTPTASTDDYRALATALQALSPSVSRVEAIDVAYLSFKLSSELDERFERSSSPMFHNFLVNVGIKEQGLCYEYADELLEALRELAPKTLNIYRVVSKKGEYFEHNALLVTSKETLHKGVVLDPWRRAEPLFWISLSKDRYNWSIVKRSTYE